MTAKEIIEQAKAEFKKRREYYADLAADANNREVEDYYRGAEVACDEILDYFNNIRTEESQPSGFNYTQGHHTAMILSIECMNQHGWFERERQMAEIKDYIEKTTNYGL